MYHPRKLVRHYCLAVECPRCSARRGYSCRTPGGGHTDLHAARIEAAVEDPFIRHLLKTLHYEEGIEEHDS